MNCTKKYFFKLTKLSNFQIIKHIQENNKVKAAYLEIPQRMYTFNLYLFMQTQTCLIQIFGGFYQLPTNHTTTKVS